MNKLLSDHEENQAIIKFVGEPQELSAKGEKSRWKNFLELFSSLLTKGGVLASKTTEMTQAYYAAETSKKKSEGDKFAAEAINITEQAKYQNVKAVNEIITDIFTDDKLPPMAKNLKLANLFANYPELANQFEKINQLASTLTVEHSSAFDVRIEPLTLREVDSPKSLNDLPINDSNAMDRLENI